jgi:hypothetical protein
MLSISNREGRRAAGWFLNTERRLFHKQVHPNGNRAQFNF